MNTKTIKNLSLSLVLGTALCFTFTSCSDDDDDASPSEASTVSSYSKSPVLVDLKAGFEDVKVFNILSSEDQIEATPDFIYGSMADGAGLLKNSDGTYTLINNIEADYSVARITLDANLKPTKGEYILNSAATTGTAQCSGTLITPNEHGFGPLYLSGGEWEGSTQAVFATDPFRNTSEAGNATVLTALGQWTTENAVPLGKEAYSDKTVVFIGDDQSNNEVPSGQLAMYVGARGDLESGKLYGFKVSGADVEMDMKEGKSYDIEFVELTEKTLAELDAECKAKGVMGFSRVEDIDYQKGSASNQREVYFCVTGRKKDGLVGKGSLYGRLYKITMNENDPTAPAKITCVLDGDNLTGKAKQFHSPDNIVVTENYAYIQEDPNGYPDTNDKSHFAYVYQYNLKTGDLKVVMECDQARGASLGYGSTERNWEFTGMIDISETTGMPNTFLLITQNHGWEKADGTPFTDPKAVVGAVGRDYAEGSMLYVIQGLPR